MYFSYFRECLALISGDKTEKNEMGEAFSSDGEGRGVYRVLVRKPEEKRPMGRSRRRWKDNIMMDLQELRYGGMDRIELAQDRDRWRALVNAVTVCYLYNSN
jgi:hypothetical protein